MKLCSYNIANGYNWKASGIAFIVALEAAWSSAAIAATQHISADNKEFVSVNVSIWPLNSN